MHYAGKQMGDSQDIFKQFIRTMNDVLSDNSTEDGRNQQALLEDLFALESKFKDTLISTPDGKKVYLEFIDFIRKEKGNILSARIYFRERQDVFSSKISKCFKERKHFLLYRFSINYNFAKWVCDRYTGPKSRSLNHTFNKIIKIRKVLCENNIPLAINRAKIFWSRIPNSHLEYMDFIQNASEGLMNAIDKFVPPYKTVFRSVAIGRMTLNMLTDHNTTMVKFSPTEKRILYRANNARTKGKLSDQGEVLEYVRESFNNVTPEKLREILAAATGLSSLDKKSEETDMSIQDLLPSTYLNPEESLLSKELMSKVSNAMSNISIIEMKLIKMKFGVEND